MGNFDQQSANLWLIRVSTSTPASAAQWACLSESEYRRAAAFHFNHDRWLYVKAHSWLRTVLGKVIDQNPQTIQIIQDQGKKPYTVCSDPNRCGVYFSLSHTEGLIAMAFSLAHEVGIDVEKKRPISDLKQLIPAVLHPAEQERINALPEKERSAFFFRIWTAKEAYTKAIGHGLAHSFGSFSIDFGNDSSADCYVLDADGVQIKPAYVYSEPDGLTFIDDNCNYALAFAALGKPISIVTHRYTE